MKIIACLGNYSKKYDNTRHNIGFQIGLNLADRFNININQKSFSSKFGKGKINGIESIILFPQTYMNNSGKAVSGAINFYKEDFSNLIVVHDEIELKFADIKVKFSGGHKGHNGLRSIFQESGENDFHRLRFGVGRPENPNVPVADYLLSRFSSEEMSEIDRIMPDTVDILIEMIS
jgi:peptidyl-tRNA hydrolase, PTH1 family